MAKFINEDIFSSMPSEGSSGSTGFNEDYGVEEPAPVDEEQLLRDRIARVNSSYDAIWSSVKAQGDKPSSSLLDKLSSLKEERNQLQDSLLNLLNKKAGPETPTAAVEPVAATTPAGTTTTALSQKKPSNLLAAIKGPTGSTEESTTIPTPGADEEITPLKTTEEDTLLGRLKAAESTKKEERRRADIGQVAELVGRSLAKIGAAQTGMRKGIDLSAVGEGKGVDWEARRKEISDDYSTELASIAKEREQLVQKEKNAADAANQKELLDLRKQEYKLGEREINAKIAASQADIRLKQAEALKSMGTMSKEEREASMKYREEFNKANSDFDKVNSAVQTVYDSIDAADKLAQEGKGREAGFEDRKAITAYLKSLDPQSAVLAAEYVGAKSIGERNAIFEKMQGLGVTEAFKDWTDALLGGTLQPGVRASLKEATKTLEGSTRKTQAVKNKAILRSAYSAGVTQPDTVLGRNPRPDELDEVTGAVWGERTSSGTKEPATGAAVPVEGAGRRSTGPAMKASELP